MKSSTLNAMLESGAFDEVIAASDRLAAERPLTSYETYLRGVAMYQTGAHRSAIEALGSAAESHDLGFWSNHWKGRAHEAIGDLADAARCFRCAQRFAESPENEQAYMSAAFRLLGSGGVDPEVRAEEAERLRDFVERQLARAARKLPDGSGEIQEVSNRLTSLEERQRDLEIGIRSRTVGWTEPFEVSTAFPVAFESNDHLQPRGTLNDNTRSPRFVAACETIFGKSSLHALDLGCAGGALVRDFLLAGHRACGLEGSDRSLRARRAEWRTLPDHLKTCDITRPFQILDASTRTATFDVISAWEVLEHLPESALPTFFANVKMHLSSAGLFVASVATFEDEDAATGVVWHVTVKPADWWEEQLTKAGLKVVASPFTAADYPRGSGNGPNDWNVALNPELGFHVVARHASDT